MHQNTMMQNRNQTAVQIATATIERRQETVDALIYKVIEQQQRNDKIVQVGVDAMNKGRIVDIFA